MTKMLDEKIAKNRTPTWNDKRYDFMFLMAIYNSHNGCDWPTFSFFL